MVTNKEIQTFWEEFKAISTDLIRSPNDKNLIKEINASIMKLGNLDWEYGPFNDKNRFYFCLSPNFNAKNIPVIEQIITAAPKIERWKFLAYKPKKEWVGRWKMEGNNDRILTIDSTNWKAVAYKFPDNTYDIDVKLDSWNYEEDASIAVDILLVNVLGEEKYMRLVENVRIVDEFEGDSKDKGIYFRYLDKVIV